MRERRDTRSIIVADGRYSSLLARIFAAATGSPEPVRASVEALVAISEADPEGARGALWQLQTDWRALERLERALGGDPTQATLRIGAAIHLARAELASSTPQLRRRLPELMEWLERRELSATD